MNLNLPAKSFWGELFPGKFILGRTLPSSRFSLSKCHRNDKLEIEYSNQSFVTIKSLTPFLHYPRPMFIILFLRDPQLMERAQTSQDTPANPTPKLPLHHLARRDHAHPDAGIRNLQFLLQAVGEPCVPCGGAGDDDVSQKVGAQVDVDL